MLLHVLVGHVRHLLDVSAGSEHALTAVDDNGSDIVATLGLGAHFGDLALHLRVECVHLGPVEADGPHTVADFESYELSHEHAFRSMLSSRTSIGCRVQKMRIVGSRVRSECPNERQLMFIGGSIFLLALGAILSFAVRDNINEVDLVTVGYILMGAGALGLMTSLIINGQNRETRVVERRDPPPA